MIRRIVFYSIQPPNSRPFVNAPVMARKVKVLPVRDARRFSLPLRGYIRLLPGSKDLGEKPGDQASARMRYTDARPIPRRFAISVGPTPASFSSNTSSAFALAVGLRPLYFPAALAFAIPSR